ncbi:MAG: UDP-N-acetylmuramoyl-tripeptide--D-alanyl-D-alanine ligase [Candidatus Atribacteria bacterium]|nr:UDP-N-acetylmuramoyl-tripeptide--D-alanyl-D-alanine ligase [Candidatus Atribacteria bacterium]
MITKPNILFATGAKIIVPGKQETFDKVLIDSRQNAERGLFVALKGKKTDGHAYLYDAWDHGARAALISQKVNAPEGFGLYLVHDTVEALKNLGKFCSKNLAGKKIAITGTVGKTTTKFFFQKILGSRYRVTATPFSYNTNIGVSTSICNFDPQSDFFIIEAGINKRGEMSELAEIIEPELVVFTAFGKGHLEGFGNVETVIQEKIVLAENAKIIYLNGDNPYALKLKEDFSNAGKKVILFGLQNHITSQLSLLDYHLNPSEGMTRFRCQCEGRISLFQVPIFSPELIILLLPVLHQAFQLGIEEEEIQKVLHEILLPEGREKIYHVGEGYLIDDSYNANPISLHKALNLLKRFSYQGYQTWVVLGDMLEMGSFSEAIHQESIRSLEEHKIKNVILYGSMMHEAAEKILSRNSVDGEYYLASSHEEIKKILLDQIPFPFSRVIVLFKGSRAMKLEEAIPTEWIEHETWNHSQ